MQHTQAMIHGLGSGLGLLVQLIAGVVQQGRFGNFRQGPVFPPPAGEVEQIVSVSAQGTRGELAHTLGVEKGVGPCDFLRLLIEQSIGTSASQRGRSVEQGGFHSGCAPCKLAVKSAALAPATK